MKSTRARIRFDPHARGLRRRRGRAPRWAPTAAPSPASAPTTSPPTRSRAVVERTGVDPERIADVYFGAANQSGEDNRDVARMAALLAGLPQSVPGATVNRLCASGLEAVN